MLGYKTLQLQKDQDAERKELETKAERGGLWQGLGQLMGTLLPLAVPGWGWAAKAALSGAGSLLGGEVMKGAGYLTGGVRIKDEDKKFHKGARADIMESLKTFSPENLAAAGTSAVTTGMGAYAADYAAAKTAATQTAQEAAKQGGTQFVPPSSKDIKALMPGGFDISAATPAATPSATSQSQSAFASIDPGDEYLNDIFRQQDTTYRG